MFITMSRSLKFLSYTFFLAITIIGIFSIYNARFEFNFEDFFPQNDPDLEFFLEFIDEFETDDNFFLVALENEGGIFEEKYLQDLDSLTKAVRNLPNVKEVMSLTTLFYPVKTPFGITSIPAVHPTDPDKFESDRQQLANDERFLKTLVSEDFTSSIINIKVKDSVNLELSNVLVVAIDSVVNSFDFEEAHYLGRANFQKEMIEMSSNEIIKSSVLAGLLVLFIMILIYRKVASVLLTMFAIGLSMMGFLSYMWLSGQAFNAMAGLYPILMIIVSTSDIIHLLSKYIDELRKGKNQREAIKITLKDIGLATLLTSITTAAGFATLLFSRLSPIQNFGINAAVGVLIAFVIIFLFCAIFLPMFSLEQLAPEKRGMKSWENWLEKWYQQTLAVPRRILAVSVAILLLAFYGISTITTNYKLASNLPLKAKITEDYHYFEQEYAGFRPLEVAIQAGEGKLITDYDVMQQIVAVENHIKRYPAIGNVTGYSLILKSINRMMNGNKLEYYQLPQDSSTFEAYKKMASLAPKMTNSLLLSADGKKSRISSRVDDIGAEEVQARVNQIDQWISENTDPDLVTFKLTGTAMILDKNMFYVRESLLKGLGLAILIVSILMVLLFKNIRLILISIIPNLFPLLTSAAIIGFMGIELEAGMSIVFAIAFGIAVDDTIHFLSKFKIERNKGNSVEDALHTTFIETGKAIILTSLILFFGFMVMFFSIHPPSRSIGILIAVTLVAALVADLYLIPVLIRGLFAKKS